jgi:acyl-coenzyme A synthetase/AMP-(fatty) acid ligase
LGTGDAPLNIIEPFLHQCRYNAHAAAICVPGANDTLVSYGRLARFMNNVSRKALHAGLGPGSNVALFVNHPLLHSIFILGLTRIGVVTLSGRNPVLPENLKIDALITDGFFPYKASRVIRADFGWTEGDGSPLSPNQVPATKSDDVCRIVVTSGTTGEGKAVALTHRMLSARIARHSSVFGSRLPVCTRTYCDLGFATSLGYQFLIYMLWRGGMLVLPGESVDALVRALTAYEVENMLTSPAGLATYLQYFEERPALRCGLDLIFTGGSMMSETLASRAHTRMCAHIVAAYGATEASMVAAAPVQMLAGIPGAVGHVMPDQTVQIVTEAGTVLPPGKEGVVRVGGPYNVDGYLGDTESNTSAFRNGWFYPGDLGRLQQDAMLVISGREKAVLNLGGDKVKPEMVEEVLKSYPGMDDAAVFSVSNELGVEEIRALIVTRSQWSDATLRNHCEKSLPRTFVPARFIAIESLPKNAMGKTERRNLAMLAPAKLD